MKRFVIGSVHADYAARNHVVCEGPVAVVYVLGTGYPVGRGWSPESEKFAAWVCEAMNEKAEREAAQS